MLKDDVILGLMDADKANIKYHVNTCYANYQKKNKQISLKKNNDILSSIPLFANTGSPNPTCSRAK